MRGSPVQHSLAPSGPQIVFQFVFFLLALLGCQMLWDIGVYWGRRAFHHVWKAR
jgi:hypothetical protein